MSRSSSSEGFSFLTKCNHLFSCRPSGQVEGTECTRAKSLQSCPNLCNPKECSLPGSSAHGILQARILEGVAMPSSRGSPLPRDQMPLLCLRHRQAGSLTLAPPGQPGDREELPWPFSGEQRALWSYYLHTDKHSARSTAIFGHLSQIRAGINSLTKQKQRCERLT